MAGLDDLMEEGLSLKTPGLSAGLGNSSNKELMADARAALSGNWGMGVAGYVLYSILIFSFWVFINSAAFIVVDSNTVDAVVQIALALVAGAFAVGFCSYYLVIAQEGAARLECLFTGFKRFFKSLGVYFFYTLFIFLWLLLFIIPGIIASFRYAMAFFIIADDEDCGPLEAISRSKAMMKGRKWKFFCLNWRFFWWGLLCMLTFGIGFLWLVPYMQTSFAKFYEDVK